MKAMPAFFALATGSAGTGTVTLNPSDKEASLTLSGGDLIVTREGVTDTFGSVRATRSINAASDNGYFEVYISEGSQSPFMLIGVAPSGLSLSSYVGSSSTSWGYYQEDGDKVTNAVQSAYGTSYTNTNVIGVAVKNGKIWFAKNNTWQASGNPAADTGEAFSGLTGNVFPCLSLYRRSIPAHVLGARFKAADFTYSPPSGFSAWEF